MQKPYSDFNILTQRFDSPEVRALFLMGSYVRGNSVVFSDVDLVKHTDVEVAKL